MFDLRYYDQLGQFEEPYRLTVGMLIVGSACIDVLLPDASRTYPIPNEETTLVPPIDHCIRTRLVRPFESHVNRTQLGELPSKVE